MGFGDRQVKSWGGAKAKVQHKKKAQKQGGGKKKTGEPLWPKPKNSAARRHRIRHSFPAWLNAKTTPLGGIGRERRVDRREERGGGKWASQRCKGTDSVDRVFQVTLRGEKGRKQWEKVQQEKDANEGREKKIENPTEAHQLGIEKDGGSRAFRSFFQRL